jgi:hypothetical protein
MRTSIGIVTAVALCCLCSTGFRADLAAGVNGPSSGKERSVMIELTKLDVTDSSLGLTCTIRNSSDHDVWVCSKVSSISSEVYLTDDQRTLLIRRRLDVPSTNVWHRPPAAGTYIRIGPGAAYPESLLLDLPVTRQSIYASPVAVEVPRTARCLALEIGYYDEDLPALVHSVLDTAGKFSTDTWSLDPNIERTYFRGLAVRRALAGYDTKNKDPYGEGRVYIDYSYQALVGEKVLRMEVDGVAIPYAGTSRGQ